MTKILKSLTRPEDCSHHDWLNLQLFAAALFVPFFIIYCALLTSGESFIVTIATYLVLGGVTVYIAMRQVRTADVIILIALYSFIAVNFLIDPSRSEFYFNPKMIIVYFFYLPAGVFCFRKIKRWDLMWDVCRPYCLASLFIAVTTVLMVDTMIYFGKEYYSYMPYSYCVIPFAMVSYVLARRDKSIFWFAVFLLLFFSVFTYGARFAVLMVPLFIIGYECVTGSRLKRIVFFVTVCVVGVLSYVFMDEILNQLRIFPFLENSRFLTKMLSKAITDGGERDLFINESVRQLMHMEYEVPGLFGDRKYIMGPYPHSIIYEVMLQFGWILGTLILAFFAFLVVYTIFFSKKQVIGIFLFFALFCKFFLSDTYVMAGNFWLWLFSALSLCDFGQEAKRQIVARRRSRGARKNRRRKGAKSQQKTKIA